MVNRQQGDQYSIPIKITQKGTVVTPDNVTDVRIKIADTLFAFEDEEHPIQFDTTTQQWKVYITEEFSRTLTPSTPIQVGIKNGLDVIYSPVTTLAFDTSLITEDWMND